MRLCRNSANTTCYKHYGICFSNNIYTTNNSLTKVRVEKWCERDRIEKLRDVKLEWKRFLVVGVCSRVAGITHWGFAANWNVAVVDDGMMWWFVTQRHCVSLIYITNSLFVSFFRCSRQKIKLSQFCTFVIQSVSMENFL